MTTIVLRKKLTDYLQVADDRKIKAIYTMLEEDIDTKAHEIDDNMFKELKKRSNSLKNNTAKTYTWEQTKADAIKRLKSKRK